MTPWWGAGRDRMGNLRRMERPIRFEDNRFLGDKRTQVVYDLDAIDTEDGEAVVAELVTTPFTQTFGPDTLPEARNRGYRLRTI